LNDRFETSGNSVRRENPSDAERAFVADELGRLKKLIRVRAILEDRGASVTVIAEHSAEIERLRERLANQVRETAA
jgi:hypothetical protein